MVVKVSRIKDVKCNLGFGHLIVFTFSCCVCYLKSPLEEGEHAGDTDDDVMMIDDLGSKRGGKGRERRRSSRDRRSRSRSGSRGGCPGSAAG